MRVEIPKAKELEQRVFDIHNVETFSSIALDVYLFQFANNPVYADFCNAVYRTPASVRRMSDIPFLPISFFKTHRIETTAFDPRLVFKSSGTTGMTASIHYVKDAGLYEKSFLKGFETFYGNPRDFCIIGLLPSYLERGQSSLVYMVDHLIRKSHHRESGFYLDDLERLDHSLKALELKKQRTILVGVTYALLDFGARYPQKLSTTVVMETGGMKGRGKEMTRNELYERLKELLGVAGIHSEYGMTELLSQAYAVDGLFRPVPWMKVLMRDETDPFTCYQSGSSSGAINLIDLANLYSCSFIATDDVGKSHVDGSFEVLGRMDNSDIRGCSLMVV
jgi:hypothetical protein